MDRGRVPDPGPALATGPRHDL